MYGNKAKRFCPCMQFAFYSETTTSPSCHDNSNDRYAKYHTKLFSSLALVALFCLFILTIVYYYFNSSAIPPPVSWAQRNDLVYVIIDVECKDIDHK